MEKFKDCSGDKEDYSFELRNFELKFFAGPPANLSEELNQLVEQRHSTLGGGPKQKQTGLMYQHFEVSNALQEF